MFERKIKCLSRPQKFLSGPEKSLSAMRKCWQVNLNVFGDIEFIEKFLRYKIPNLKCRRNFYPLGQAYECTKRNQLLKHGKLAFQKWKDIKCLSAFEQATKVFEWAKKMFESV